MSAPAELQNSSRVSTVAADTTLYATCWLPLATWIGRIGFSVQALERRRLPDLGGVALLSALDMAGVIAQI